ncbi:MAG: DnaJ domain-containing protein [Pseudomonadales bacterium]
MVIVLAAVMAAVGFIVLMRLLWVAKRPSVPTVVVTVAVVALIGGLAILTATGRLSWIAAVGAAILPFLRRLPSLLRYLPLFRGLFGAYQRYGQNSGSQGGGSAPSGEMSVEQAREVLGVGPDADRDAIIAAHRRLMQKLHPDRGGSTYLAQQLNEAKRILLKTAR